MYLKREILAELEQWKNNPNRKPLILRGARQVGKTTAVHMFAEKFDHYIYLNLEKEEDKNLYEQTGSFQEFLEAIFFAKKIPKSQRQTLIFIDEIQSSPKTVAMLRFFKEEAPQLFVIVAGSLLETLMNVHISFPVGRVEYRYLYPMTFREFLWAANEAELLEFLHSGTIPTFAHNALLKQFHRYTLIGGMPEVVKDYVENKDLTSLAPIYEALLTSYLDDVEKYAPNISLRQVLRHCIRSSFFEAGKRIKFQGFGQSNYRSREVGEALRTLEKAMLLTLIYPTTSTKLPLTPNLKKSPKLHVLDTGLINYFVGLQEEIFRTPLIDSIYEGRIAEHIAGQELLARRHSRVQPLVFWTREKKQSTAEVDYLVPYKQIALPIEVKSGKAGRLRSLHLFMDQTEHPYAMRVHSGPLSVDEVHTIGGKKFNLINLPFYLLGSWQNVAEEIIRL